jgi:hypothetical protein
VDLQPVPHILSVCCNHVVHGERPVRLVGRPDGDWTFSCGAIDHAGIDDLCLCGMSHLFDDDPSLHEVLDLAPWEEAERADPGAAWMRGVIPPDEG